MNNWFFERSSGYAGHRCDKCATWVYDGQPKVCQCDEKVKIDYSQILCLNSENRKTYLQNAPKEEIERLSIEITGSKRLSRIKLTAEFEETAMFARIAGLNSKTVHEKEVKNTTDFQTMKHTITTPLVAN